jgi:hypothetical protein
MLAIRGAGLAAIVATAMLVAGCGGDGDGDGGGTSKEDYSNELESVIPAIGDEIVNAQEVAQSPQSVDELAGALSDIEGAIGDAKSKLQDLDPPDDVADLNTELIQALDTFEGAVAGVRKELEAGTPGPAVDQFTTKAAAFFEQITSIRSQLEDAGVEIGDPLG